MTWTFRLRIRLDQGSRLQVSDSELHLPELSGVGRVEMSASPTGIPIADAEWLVLKGAASAEKEAWTRGTRLADLLRRTFARLGMAAELGREATWRMTPAGRALLSENPTGVVLDNVHGLMVYRADANAKFVEIGPATLRVGLARWRFVQTLVAADTPRQPTDGERAAFDLYSGYRFENSPAARLLTLTMAVESLVSPPLRSKAASALVELLIVLTRNRSRWRQMIENAW